MPTITNKSPRQQYGMWWNEYLSEDVAFATFATSGPVSALLESGKRIAEFRYRYMPPFRAAGDPLLQREFTSVKAYFEDERE